MPAGEADTRIQTGRIKDARGRLVSQLDPVTMHVLRQHDVIEADELRAIAGEPGVRISGMERAWLVVGLIGALCVISLFTIGVVTGNFRQAFYAKSSGLLFLGSMPLIAWYSIKKARFGKVAATMLKYMRCPHCGYSLRMLPVDADDGCTVCPECGCAWNLGTVRPDPAQDRNVQARS